MGNTGYHFFLPKYEFPIFIKLDTTTPYMSQNVACVAGGSGCPRELPNASAKSRAGREKNGEESREFRLPAKRFAAHENSSRASSARELAASPQKVSRAHPLPPATQATQNTMNATYAGPITSYQTPAKQLNIFLKRKNS